MPDPNYIMLPDLGLAFLLPAKTGNTSIKLALLDHLGIDPQDRPHDPRHFRYASSKEEVVRSGLAIFGTIRHPLARLVSAWADKCSHDDAMINGLRALGCRVGMPFEAFARRVIESPDVIGGRRIDQHVRPQYLDLCWHSGQLIPDAMLRFEHLSADWARLLPDLPPLGRHQVSKHKRWQAYYPPALLEAAALRFASDLELGSYEL